jgi:lysophospholipase L1-like esterase
MNFSRVVVFIAAVATAAFPAAAASAFVYQYDGMTLTNRLPITSVRTSGVNRTLTWTAPRDFAGCGVGFEFVATEWSTNNYVFAPAALYDGNRFDIAFIGYAPYITNWQMPHKANRPVVTTNIHHLNKDGSDARIDFLAGETSAPMIGYWDAARQTGHLYLADPLTPLGETGFSVRESPKNGTCTFVLSAPGIRTTKYTMCRSRREDCGDRAPTVKKGTTVTFGVSVVTFKAENVTAFLARAFDVRKLRTGRTVHAVTEDPQSVIEQILANEDAYHWYEDPKKGLGYYCNQPRGNSPFGHLQLGWNGVPVYLLPILERPTPERLRRCALTWDTISSMNGKSGLYYAINRRGELLGDAFGRMSRLRDHAMIRRTAITIYYGIQSLRKMASLGVAVKPEWKASVRKACDGVSALWKRYGQLGQYVKVDSGEIHAPNSTNGALVPGALALASSYFGNPAYLETAKATARYLYEHDLAKGYCGGGPAEILEAPDSESSCELGESFIALWEVTGEKEWVAKAEAAAAMYATWVEAFDYTFPRSSRMAKLGIKTTGSVWASVQNRHSAPGPYVMSADWLVKLSRATGDSRYAQVFYDNALNIAQYATTRQNRFMPRGRPGTLTERVNTCDWEGRRGIGAVMDRDSNQAWENVALFTLLALQKNTLYRPRAVDGVWCSLGTSITWYDSNVANARGRFTRGYQDRVRDVLRFKGFINRGVNGGTVAAQNGRLAKADYYTIEHGINDWGQGVKPGVFADYANNTSNRTFYAGYRILIDQIRTLNPRAKIILCTPRKGYGFGRYLPPKSTLPHHGAYLSEYAEAVRAIAQKEGFAVADFYAACGEEAELADLSIDTALHPNDPGYQRMADELIRAFGTILP